jgi:hypothetical protein
MHIDVDQVPVVHTAATNAYCTQSWFVNQCYGDVLLHQLHYALLL